MRYITADYIFPVSSPPMKNGVVVVDDSGIIRDLLPAPSLLPTETYKGILCPGFINAHCHLELSHLEGKLSEGKGLPQFIKEIIPGRNAAPEVIQKAIADAEQEMIANGIVGVGDICNTNHTFAQKAKGNMRYHNFIEVFDLTEEHAIASFERGRQLAGKLKPGSQSSITPHAPYSVSEKLLQLIRNYAAENNSILSIHNQETAGENELFVSATGPLFETMKPFIGNRQAKAKRSFEYITERLAPNKILYVHNTYTSKEDLSIRNPQSAGYFCFCPNANLYIEKRLPGFQLFMDAGCTILVGTDSYASNRSLSILDELKTIHEHAPAIPLQTLLQWATLNGAVFFGWEADFGSLEKGKKPGLNLVENIDPATLVLNAQCTVRKIA